MNKKEKITLLAKDGIFHIFAIDHRDVLTVRMEEKIEGSIDDQTVLNEKCRLIEAIGNMSSAVLIDTHYFIQDKILDKRLNMSNVLIGIEKNNYDTSKIGEGYLTDDISIVELAKSGCNMIKLFVYYHPNMKFTSEIDNIIAYVDEECKKYQVPFMLEPILYQVEQEDKLELTKVMLNRLKKFDIDLYKIDFPGNVNLYSYEENMKICAEINDLLNNPWIILSSGVSEEEFKLQLEIAGKSGACGYAVGRSVWNKYICENKLAGMQKTFDEIRTVAQKHCKKWAN